MVVFHGVKLQQLQMDISFTFSMESMEKQASSDTWTQGLKYGRKCFLIVSRSQRRGSVRPKPDGQIKKRTAKYFLPDGRTRIPNRNINLLDITKFIQPWWLGVFIRHVFPSVNLCFGHTVDRIPLGTMHGTGC